MLRVGFIGLGNMGEGMAHNLARAGFPLTVRDLRPEPLARLTEAGASIATSNLDLGRASLRRRHDLSAARQRGHE
jgi:3-hydroxyisobutyrate dehydrogenase